ncbi:uncharacterized protein LOC111913598 [Lactuca sativa]|uniref:uncharacterized protein LOC111913598 n=1 Tax=Lactuca sativa TaxID=4236 RepID=UPI000CD80C62|nr:uncharacterized protein LOC111913598 [Lactuca sativa]
MAAVAAIMAQLNANHASRHKDGVRNTNRINNQEHQRASTNENASGHKPTNKKQKFWNEKESNQSQRLAKRQQPMTTPTITTAVTTHASTLATGSVTQAPARPYEGSLPKCNKCGFHHNGVCRVMHCKNCDKNGHTACFCRNQTQHLPSITSTKVGPVCYLCGETGHFKRECPTEKNDGRAGGV